MKKNKINHNALLHLIEADAISIAIVKAIGDTWVLSVQVGETLKVVMAKNSGKPRVWRKLDTLAKYLQDIGLNNFHVDVAAFDPSQKSLRRPDSASSLKRTHQAHQSLKKRVLEESSNSTNSIKEEGLIDVKVEDAAAQIKHQESQSQNATDRAIELAKRRWEQRRASILDQEKVD